VNYIFIITWQCFHTVELVGSIHFIIFFLFIVL
jgi:hypothetical protein